MTKQITTLYDHYKNSPKKLKIICDWDEVIQATEPYSVWLTVRERENRIDFTTFFKVFWSNNERNIWEMDYSLYGSNLKMLDKKRNKKVSWFDDLGNPDDFYQQAPFLTIAEDLLKLIKENKIEQLIFLSAGDARKKEMFKETFGKFDEVDNTKEEWDIHKHKISLFLLSEMFGIRTKSDWIKKHVADFDLMIDDNPNICRSIIIERSNFELFERMFVIAPHYPAIENQHDERMQLVKQEVSNLKKEDF